MISTQRCILLEEFANDGNLSERHIGVEHGKDVGVGPEGGVRAEAVEEVARGFEESERDGLLAVGGADEPVVRVLVLLGVGADGGEGGVG